MLCRWWYPGQAGIVLAFGMFKGVSRLRLSGPLPGVVGVLLLFNTVPCFQEVCRVA